MLKQIFMTFAALSACAIDVAELCADDGKHFAKWQPVELAFRGPASRGRGSPNPFSISLDVVFKSPTGKTYAVPGFYDGDGKGGLDGDVWKVRFSADEPGQWTYKTTSSNKRLVDNTGRFEIADVAADAKGFWKWGRLEYTGTPKNGIRYLKFRDGPYWLKAGCDDPENFLGRYQNYNTLSKRKASIDYLASKGINSLYIMTHNVDGDDRDVWPWLGETAKQAMSNGGKNARFDVAKLEEWRVLFEHMQTKGVVTYLVLEDDSAWKGYDHDRYYREMIARFGYLPALIFNFNEEHNENYRLAEALQYMRQLGRIDPYDHPRGIHNVNSPSNEYVDAVQVDFTSIQTGSPGSRSGLQHAIQHNRIAVDWIDRCRARGRRVLMVNFDEGRPPHDRRAWWSAYLGGGVWEAHLLPPYDRPYSAWDKVWTELGGTRAFMQSLPFWEMQPHNHLVRAGQAFCLAKPDAAYALYLPAGGGIQVKLPASAEYDYAWWNPANGADGGFERKGRTSGGIKNFTAPGKGDWALRIIKAGD